MTCGSVRPAGRNGWYIAVPLSNLPGPWRWERRRGYWWRIHDELRIEDGPHTWDELNIGLGGFADHHSEWYDKDGEPVPVLVANDLLAQEDYKIVEQDIFVIDDEPVKVSTVWIGLNHNWWPGGPIKIFETMIFGGEHHMEQWRYSTQEEAREGHAHAVSLVQLERQGGENGEDSGGQV